MDRLNDDSKVVDQENIEFPASLPPVVLVLMPLFRSIDVVDMQISSILNQSGVAVKLVCYDDSPAQESRLYVEARYPNVLFLESGLRFGNAARSFFFLLRHTKSLLHEVDWVAFSDHDDIWGRDKLCHAILCLRRENAVGFSSSVTSIGYGSEIGFSAGHHVGKVIKQTPLDYFFEGPGPGCSFVMAPSFITNEVLPTLDHPKIDTIFWHDWFIYFLARARGYSWYISDVSHILYVQYGTNETGVNRGWSAAQRRLAWLRSGWYIRQALAMADVANHKAETIDRLQRLSWRDLLYFSKNVAKLRRRFAHCLVILITLFLVGRRDDI